MKCFLENCKGITIPTIILIKTIGYISCLHRYYLREEEDKVFVLVIIILMICATILFGMYLYFCAENRIGIFDCAKYKNDIKDIKNAINELTDEVQKVDIEIREMKK